MQFEGFESEVASIQSEMQAVLAQASQVQAELSQSMQVAQKRIDKTTSAHQQFSTKWGLKIKEQATKGSAYDRVFDVSSSKIDF